MSQQGNHRTAQFIPLRLCDFRHTRGCVSSMSSKQNRPPYRAIGGLFECNWRFTRPSALTSPQFAAHLNVLADVLDNPLLFVLGILARVSDISLECRTENFRVGQGPGRCDGVTVRRQGPAFDEVE